MAKTSVVTCKRRAWISHKKPTRLFGEGDPFASMLLCGKGRNIRLADVVRFENAADFFDGMPAPEVEGDGLDELTVPQLRERCEARGIDARQFGRKADYVAALRVPVPA